MGCLLGEIWGAGTAHTAYQMALRNTFDFTLKTPIRKHSMVHQRTDGRVITSTKKHRSNTHIDGNTNEQMSLKACQGRVAQMYMCVHAGT